METNKNIYSKNFTINCLWKIAILNLIFLFSLPVQSQEIYNKVIGSENLMDSKYWEYWNPQVQKSIDVNIERNRKSDAVFKIDDVAPGTEVEVVQTSHEFIFGGNIFLFDDLGTEESNSRYRGVFQNLFNAATIPFYWKTLEPEKGRTRYREESTYEYRRPPTDPVVDFCESNGVNMNGHTIIYGMRKWGHPVWMPEDREQMEIYFEQHIKELAARYKDRIHRWDVVNEPTDQANRGVMPDDYTFKSFTWADKYFLPNVKLNINDSNITWDMTMYRRYKEVIRNLISRGVVIDQVGLQMHVFNLEKIRKGDEYVTPDHILERLDYMSEVGLPIHISEVTIAAPDNGENGQKIQAVVARNFYRLLFSYENVMGITWWNVVDGGAAAGEPSYSGLLDENINSKLVYNVLEELINNEWKTSTKVRVEDDGTIRFRGFRGKYKISWKDKYGSWHTRNFLL